MWRILIDVNAMSKRELEIKCFLPGSVFASIDRSNTGLCHCVFFFFSWTGNYFNNDSLKLYKQVSTELNAGGGGGGGNTPPQEKPPFKGSANNFSPFSFVSPVFFFTIPLPWPPVGGGGGAGDPHIKRSGVLVVLLGVKRRFGFLCWCSVSKGPQLEPLCYLLGYWAFLLQSAPLPPRF